MLTAPELVKLIKAHNILSKITIPKKAINNVNDLIKLIESKNYSVDHNKKSIKPKVQRGKQITLKQAEEITMPKVDPVVAKQKREAKKKEKEEEKKKEIKIAKKEAVQEFKQKKQEAEKKKPKPAPKPKIMKKEDEVRPKEKVGRPRVDPSKIKVLERKQGKELISTSEDKILKNNLSNNKKDMDKQLRIKELYTKLGYDRLPYPAQLTQRRSAKLDKLEEKRDALEDSMKGKPLKEKLSIKKEIDILKKEINKEIAELRKNPKKLNKDEKELLEYLNEINNKI
jgi:hypothetical protein